MRAAAEGVGVPGRNNASATSFSSCISLARPGGYGLPSMSWSCLHDTVGGATRTSSTAASRIKEALFAVSKTAFGIHPEGGWVSVKATRPPRRVGRLAGRELGELVADGAESGMGMAAPVLANDKQAFS